jgi:hypothetical protein
MDMEMVYGLASVLLAVDDEAGALFPAARLFGQFLGLYQKAPDKKGVPVPGFHDACDMPFGNNQKMNRRLGPDVMECQHIIIFVDFPAGYFTPYDPAKDTIAHGPSIARAPSRWNSPALFDRHGCHGQKEKGMINH